MRSYASTYTKGGKARNAVYCDLMVGACASGGIEETRSVDVIVVNAEGGRFVARVMLDKDKALWLAERLTHSATCDLTGKAV